MDYNFKPKEAQILMEEKPSKKEKKCIIYIYPHIYTYLQVDTHIHTFSPIRIPELYSPQVIISSRKQYIN